MGPLKIRSKQPEQFGSSNYDPEIGVRHCNPMKDPSLEAWCVYIYI